MRKILLLSMALMSFSVWANDSIYTKANDKTCWINPNPEAGDFEAVCPGQGGYKVQIESYGGHQFYLNLLYNYATIPTYENSSIGVNVSPNETLEWRYQQRGRNKRFYALIYRVFISKIGSKKRTSKLVVMRLNGENSCLLGVIDASKNMNVKARALADDFLAECQY